MACREAGRNGGQKMALHDLMNDDRMEMLKWVSERNLHVPLSDLAFMLDLNENALDINSPETGGKPNSYND
jgi:hypothetical protein